MMLGPQNAGIGRGKLFETYQDDIDWDLMYDVHVGGCYRVAKAAWFVLFKRLDSRFTGLTFRPVFHYFAGPSCRSKSTEGSSMCRAPLGFTGCTLKLRTPPPR